MDTLLEAGARAGVGLYPVSPYHLSPPSQAGLLLGYAAMTETEIHAGIKGLAGVLNSVRTHF
jgi:GntR family transcriptional regulator/MocR family aminotransferase